VYDSVTDEFTDSTNASSKTSFAWICHTQLKLRPFVIFLPILAKTWLPWKSPLDPCNQKCLLWIGRPLKPPAISNYVLAISRRNAFICIYSNFSPKIGCRGNATLSLVCGCVTDDFPDGQSWANPNRSWDLNHDLNHFGDSIWDEKISFETLWFDLRFELKILRFDLKNT